MKAFSPLVLLIFAVTVLCGCGSSGSGGSSDSTDLGDFRKLDAHGYLVKDDGSAFTRTSIAESVEVLSSGNGNYEVRFLLAEPLGDDEQIEVLAGEPVSSQPSTLFVLTQENLSAGSSSDLWATLRTTQVQPPLVPTDLLRTQIRTAAERGQWQFRRTKGGAVVASGFLLPNEDAPLHVAVPDTSQGLAQGEQPFGTLRSRVTGITIDARLPIANAAALGQVQGAELVVLESAAPGAAAVWAAELRFVASPSEVTITDSLPAYANDLSPEFDAHVKYLAAGIQRGLGFLRLRVSRGGVAQEIQFKVGISKP